MYYTAQHLKFYIPDIILWLHRARVVLAVNSRSSHKVLKLNSRQTAKYTDKISFFNLASWNPYNWVTCSFLQVIGNWQKRADGTSPFPCPPYILSTPSWPQFLFDSIHRVWTSFVCSEAYLLIWSFFSPSFSVFFFFFHEDSSNNAWLHLNHCEDPLRVCPLWLGETRKG